MQTCRIEFLPHKKIAQVAQNTTIRDAALSLGLVIQSPCGGAGTCGKCKVWAEQDNISEITPAEQELLSESEIDDGLRLSCSARIVSDVRCVLPETSLVTFADEQILTAGISGDDDSVADLCKIELQLSAPIQGEKYFDFDELLAMLKSKGRVVNSYEIELLRSLPDTLRSNNFQIKAVIDSDALLAVEPGDNNDPPLGIALDIGTTTIVAKLVDVISGDLLATASAANTQAIHGADVIARVSYSVYDPDGLATLHDIVVGQINGLIAALVQEAEVPVERIYKIVMAGNTVMQHLLLKINPENLGKNPYTPAFKGPVQCRAKSLALNMNPAGTVMTVPNLGGYVGGDITALLAVLDFDYNEDIQLAIDIGTNGEIVLGNKSRLICCSSPAGPAWEGARISYGARAVNGAIERVAVVDGDFQISTIGNAPAIGICGSGLFDLVSELVRFGIVEKSGRILHPEQLPDDIPYALRRRVRAPFSGGVEIEVTTDSEGNSIVLTQQDIREVQLAKAAIVAGIMMLMQELEIDAGVIQQVYIAGAFGNHIRGKDVIDIGLLPHVLQGRIQFIGNAALSGAEAILCSRRVRKRAEFISQSIDYLEVASRADFQNYYVEAMHFGLQ